ncbi:MAG: hypothetical protein ACKOB1_02735, partial [Planctomycetia bacterium]
MKASRCLLIACLCAVFGPARAEADEKLPQRLRVAATPIASAVEWDGDRPVGVMVDIWEDLAGRLGAETDFVKVPSVAALLEVLPAGKADVLLGPIA